MTSEPETSITSSWQPSSFADSVAAAQVSRRPRSMATARRLSRLPLQLLVLAWGLTFLHVQFPEVAGYEAVARIGRTTAALTWDELPAASFAGSGGFAGAMLLLASIGAVLLAVADAQNLPALFTMVGGGVVAVCMALRAVELLASGMTSDLLPALLVALLITAASVFAVREVAFTDAPESVSSKAHYRGLAGFVVFAVTWVGPVAVGRWLEPLMLDAARSTAAGPDRFAELTDPITWWAYLLGLLAAATAVAAAQLLPPWASRSKQVIVGAIALVALVIGLQTAGTKVNDEVSAHYGVTTGGPVIPGATP